MPWTSNTTCEGCGMSAWNIDTTLPDKPVTCVICEQRTRIAELEANQVKLYARIADLEAYNDILREKMEDIMHKASAVHTTWAGSDATREEIAGIAKRVLPETTAGGTKE